MPLLSHIRNLARHSAIYAISTGIQKLPGFLLLPVYTSLDYIPSRSEFGDFSMVFAFIAFMYYFYTYGMDAALMRYFFLGKWDRKTVFSSVLILLAGTSLVTSCLIYLFSSPLADWILQDPAYAHFMELTAAILLIDTVGNMPYLLLRAEEKSVQFTLFKGIRFLLELGFNILYVVILKTGVLGILYTSLSVAAVNLVMMLPVLIRAFKPVLDRALCREMLSFGLPFMPHGIAFTAIELVDRLIIPNVLDKDALGLYSANYKFGAILSVLILAFRNAWQPFFLRISQDVDARRVYARVFSYFNITAGLIVLAGYFFIYDLLTIHWFDRYYFLGPSYWGGISIIPIVLLAYCFYGSYIVLTPGFYIQKKSQYMVIFTGSAAAVNVVSNLLLLPVLNIWGAALATLLSYVTMAMTIFLVSRRIYPLSLEWTRLLHFALAAGMAAGIHFWFEPALWIRFAICVIVVVYVYRVILTAEERSAALRQARLVAAWFGHKSQAGEDGNA